VRTFSSTPELAATKAPSLMRYWLPCAAVDDLHRPRQGRRQQAIAVAPGRFDVLLEEGLAVGEGAHQRAAQATAHLALQVERRFHHDHRVGFAVDGFAVAHGHVQERIDITGNSKLRHFLASYCFGVTAPSADSNGAAIRQV
jgi:hypothetical protein